MKLFLSSLKLLYHIFPMPSLAPHTSPTGFFVAIEGIDGSGKTTAFTMLGERLSRAGIHPLLLTHEPTTGLIGKEIYDRLLGRREMVPPLELQHLYVRDRYSHVQQLIKPVLERSGVVLADRYWLSTLAHGMLDMPIEELYSLHAEVFAGSLLVPHITFLLDLPEELAFQRLQAHGKQLDHFEKRSKLSSLRKNYLSVAADVPARGYGAISIVDASIPFAEMTSCVDRMWQSIQDYRQKLATF